MGGSTASAAAAAWGRRAASRARRNPLAPLSLSRSRWPALGRPLSSDSKAAAPPSQEPVFRRVGVVGLGLMGHGIAQVSAAALSSASSGGAVWAYEAEDAFLQRGKDRIRSSLDSLVRKAKVTSERAESAWECLRFTTDVADLAECDLVVEAVVEDLQLKRGLYETLGRVLSPDCVVASNTSSLRIVDLASGYSRPAAFCGVHFFNPVQIMKLVEVVSGPETDPEVAERVRRWASDDLKKVPVACGDTPGFIVNRLLVPSLMQAMLMVDRNDANVADIDLAMQLGCGHPMGPLHLSDYIGLDTCLSIVEGWVHQYPNEPSFVVPDCLRRLVQAGHLGRKSGRGFYEWDGDKRGDPAPGH